MAPCTWPKFAQFVSRITRILTSTTSLSLKVQRFLSSKTISVDGRNGIAIPCACVSIVASNQAVIIYIVYLGSPPPQAVYSRTWYGGESL